MKPQQQNRMSRVVQPGGNSQYPVQSPTPLFTLNVSTVNRITSFQIIS